MGGVPVLLMIAAMGITYGWQPDDDGGVEYIIQVPPSELDQLRRMGEISSAIDPAVRGHVSRVVILVGDGPLPKITPRGLQAKLSREVSSLAMSDRSPIPIPEMTERGNVSPIGSVRESNATASLMKPDPDAPSTGFGLPGSLNEAAAGAAGNLRDNIDQAGRKLSDRAGQQLDQGFNSAANALREKAANMFGSSSARNADTAPRSSDPRQQDPRQQDTRQPSTEPANPWAMGPNPLDSNQQDPRQVDPRQVDPRQVDPRQAVPRQMDPRANDPRQLSANADANDPRSLFPPQPRSQSVPPFTSNASASAKSRMPSTEPADRDNSWTGFSAGPPSTQPRATTASTSPSNRRASTGLGPSDTFAKLPSGISLPSTDAARSREADLRNTAASHYEQSQADLRSGYVDPRNSGQTQTPDPRSRFSTTDATPPAPQATRIDSPDPRLTYSQINAGAWSIDRSGRLLDRQGRLIPEPQSSPRNEANDPAYWNVAANARAEADDSYARTGYSGDPASERRYADTGYANTGYERGPDYRTAAPSARPQAELARANASLPPSYSPPRSQYREPDTQPMPELAPSASDRRPGAAASTLGGSTNRDGGARELSPREVAAQPFFNGLLLISMVANLYLAFWLKNLYYRYRDLVAAKRLANANAAAV